MMMKEAYGDLSDRDIVLSSFEMFPLWPEYDWHVSIMRAGQRRRKVIRKRSAL